MLFFIILLPQICWGATEIAKVRSWAAPDHTRVVFDISDEPDYQFQVKDNVLTIEFNNASLHPSLGAEKKIGKPGVQKIIFTSTAENKSKIDIVLDRYIRVDVFKLKKIMDKPDRVVVDVVVVQDEKKDESEKETVAALPGRRKVIVIDPGHGGEDPGAIGKNGTYEKHVVLAIGRQIKKTIDKIPGFRAVLTRDGDYYVTFNKRLQTAGIPMQASSSACTRMQPETVWRTAGRSIVCPQAEPATKPQSFWPIMKTSPILSVARLRAKATINPTRLS